MSRASRPWFVGAWRRRTIVVPGGEPTEPCEAWWVQADEVFVDVRVVHPHRSDNGLPFSSTRAFAGRFEIVAGAPRWHVELDSAGIVPRVDQGAPGGLFVDQDDPLLMIEDAPDRFREEWMQCASGDEVELVRSAGLIAVRVGDVTGLVVSTEEGVTGRIWCAEHSIVVGPSSLLDRQGSAS